MVIIKMVQTNKFQWELVSPTGFVIKSDLSFHNAEKAGEYAKNYASSFLAWGYEVVPLDAEQYKGQKRDDSKRKYF